MLNVLVRASAPVRLFFATLLHIVLAAAPDAGAQESGGERNVYYILDASGSMWGRIGNEPKIEIARGILLDRIPFTAGNDVRVGIAVYGHRRKGDCGDIEEIVPLGPIDESSITKALDSIVPKGKTPMAQAVTFVTERLRVLETGSQVVLISDGEENCSADPCAAVRELKSLDIDFTLDVIGFDLTPEQKAELECMAAEGGGRYVSAQSADELEDAIEEFQEAPPLQKYAQNVQIVLDRSVNMRADFAGRSKIEVAQEKIAQVVNAPGADNENLALRFLGGECGVSANSELVVPFDIRNGKAIASALEEVALAGDPTLGEALVAAANDFDTPARFENVSNRVVVFTGSRSHCDPREMRAVYDNFLAKRIRPDFNFIAMKLPSDELADLRDLAGTTAGRVFEVETEEELDQALEEIFEVEPVLSGIRTVTELLNSVVGHLNTAFSGVQVENYDQVSAATAEGRKVIANTSVTFRDLGNRQTRELFKKLYELASDNRTMQTEAFDMVEQLVAARREKDDIDLWNRLVGELNDNIDTYNANIRQMDDLTRSF